MSMDEQNANWGNFFNGDLPGKVRRGFPSAAATWGSVLERLCV